MAKIAALPPDANTGVSTVATPSAAAGKPAACAAASARAHADNATAPDAASDDAVATAGASADSAGSPSAAISSAAPTAGCAGGFLPGSHAGHSAGRAQQATINRAIAALSTAIPATRRPRPASAPAAPEPRPRTPATEAKLRLGERSQRREK